MLWKNNNGIYIYIYSWLRVDMGFLWRKFSFMISLNVCLHYRVFCDDFVWISTTYTRIRQDVVRMAISVVATNQFWLYALVCGCIINGDVFVLFLLWGGIFGLAISSVWRRLDAVALMRMVPHLLSIDIFSIFSIHHSRLASIERTTTTFGTAKSSITYSNPYWMWRQQQTATIHTLKYMPFKSRCHPNVVRH